MDNVLWTTQLAHVYFNRVQLTLFTAIFRYKLIFGLIDLTCQTFSDYAVTTETAVISINCSFRAPDPVSDITSIPIEQQGCGMIYQLTVLTFLV